MAMARPLLKLLLPGTASLLPAVPIAAISSGLLLRILLRFHLPPGKSHSGDSLQNELVFCNRFQFPFP